VLSIVPLVDLTQQTLPAAEEVCSSVPDEGVLSLVIKEEEVTSRISKEPSHSSREGEVARKGSKELSHCGKEEGDVRVLISPRDRGSVVKETQTFVKIPPPSFPVEPTEIPSDYGRIFMAPTTYTIDFPIADLGTGTPTKPIPLTTLPSFHGLTYEDPEAFPFEFDIVCQGYYYIIDAQKLKIFPATLKGIAL